MLPLVAPFFFNMKFLRANFIFFILLFSSCQHIQERINTIVGEEKDTVLDSTNTTVLQDTLMPDSVAPLSKDSVHLKFLFKDANGRNINTRIPVLMCFNSVFETVYTNNSGYIDTIVDLNDVQIVIAPDTLYYPISDYAGEVLLEDFMLPLRSVRGRIMEEDGTPLRFMPIHVHSKFKSKGKKDIESFDDDFVVTTDSFGYYRTYVPENVFRVTLRSCGFFVGAITRYELLNYPTQNFLFIPFEFKNLCGDITPAYQMSIVLKDIDLTIPADVMSELFKYDDVLESSSEAYFIAERGSSTLRKKSTKRNAVFRSTMFTVCVH